MGEINMINVELIWKILGLVFACGVVWAKLEAIQKDIARLEKKQDKYNNLQERTRVLEVKLENHLIREEK
ncbi:MAG: hypothetical protein J6Y17_03340 [Elusimicrobiaceae bacterium]|nr:hypothetical protein [Elusimicrobiaceae bacterium]